MSTVRDQHIRKAAADSESSRKVNELTGARVHDSATPMRLQQKLTAAELTQIDAWPVH